MLAALINVLISAAIITERVPATALFLIVLVVSAIAFFHNSLHFCRAYMIAMMFNVKCFSGASVALMLIYHYHMAVGNVPFDYQRCMVQGYCSPVAILHARVNTFPIVNPIIAYN